MARKSTKRKEKAERPLWYRLTKDHEIEPVDLLEGARCFEKQDERIVARTHIEPANRLLWLLGIVPGYWVSTVFLGLDHEFGDDGPPLVFETMVFRKWPRFWRWLSDPNRRLYNPGTPPWYLRPLFWRSPVKTQNGRENYWVPRFRRWSEWSEVDTERYSTWGEAQKGHTTMVGKWLLISAGWISKQDNG